MCDLNPKNTDKQPLNPSKLTSRTTILGLACRFLSGDEGLSIIKRLVEAKADVVGRFIDCFEVKREYDDDGEVRLVEHYADSNSSFPIYAAPITNAYCNPQFDSRIVDYLIEQGELLSTPITTPTTLSGNESNQHNDNLTHNNSNNKTDNIIINQLHENHQ